MNISYVKKYDENGIVINPIVGSYTHDSDNRKSRREVKQKNRFFGNGKNAPLSVSKHGKYARRIQVVPNSSKRIEHYDLIK